MTLIAQSVTEEVADQVVEALITETAQRASGPAIPAELRASSVWADLQKSPDSVRAAVVIGAVRRVGELNQTRSSWSRGSNVASGIVTEMLRQRIALSPSDRVDLIASLLASSETEPTHGAPWSYHVAYLAKPILRALERGGDVDRLADEKKLLRELREALREPWMDAERKRWIHQIDQLLSDSDEPLIPAGPWAAAMQQGIESQPASVAAAATAAVGVAASSAGAKPTAVFTKKVDGLIDAYGADLRTAVVMLLEVSVFPASAVRGQVDGITGDVLRRLCWIAASLPVDARLASAVGGWLIAGWAKVPGFGPVSQRVANGAAWALARLGDRGAGELGRARAVLKQPQAVRSVDAAIDEAADRLGIPREEFEERVVPTYGLEVGARREVALGEHTAVLAYTAGRFGITIVAADGKARKTVPAVVKRDFAEELKALKVQAKDIVTMLAAQRMRLERLLLDDREWDAAVWRERYVDHPLISVLARNLIWQVDTGASLTAVIAVDGELCDIDGEVVEVAKTDRIRLWHPATVPIEEVGAWRRRVEDLGVVQPFKQAHREVYLLTAAEERTDIYSNRFAGHIIRQHQFAALARGRGWRYALQGAFDAPDEQAHLQLPQYGLRASLWVDRPWGAEDDWNDTGIFNHVLTDQVRFTTDRDAVHLRDVPVRVLSEVLRDVDLFVGVASIGSDPSWQDNGGVRRDAWGDYWSSYSFGELGAAAEVRKDLLSRLLPKLAIADVVRIEDRFLVVEGRLRRYRIHLGSGNILMAPNDQYLCIVPSRGEKGADGVMLPFEGDQLLGIILSKAMLLANDDKITDATITSQIVRR